MSGETGSDDDSPQILSAGFETGDEPIVIRGGVSPSGVAHLGNFNEITCGSFVAAGRDGEAIHAEMYETPREHGVEVGDFFAAGYRLFFDDTQGPRRGDFLGKLERDDALAQLRREA